MEKHFNLLHSWQYTERRHHLRRPCSIIAAVATQDQVFTDFIQNIGSGGVFIKSKAPLLNGAQISIVFSLPNFGEPFRVRANIAWTGLEGIGVRFHTVSSYLEAVIKLL